MFKRNLLLFFIFNLFLCFPSFSQDVIFQDSLSKSPKLKINKLGWMEGNWKSSGQEITVQETWTRNGSNSMMCVASIYEGTNIILFEICTITEENGTLVLRIRHFDNQLKAWESKDKPIEKQLLKVEKNRFYFDSYTFEKSGKEQMTLFIQSDEKDNLLTIPYVRI